MFLAVSKVLVIESGSLFLSIALPLKFVLPASDTNATTFLLLNNFGKCKNQVLPKISKSPSTKLNIKT
ncbi:Uncharacterised protein [Mycoplasmopsis edwardii]|uniref:Uncharacterized protein n=1 Tax=Mycoplasmopsis edwardii TaxID=53558 RepID=A0A3B0PJS9_9BACT|nr:Uncharacterised protein [Mycoplasmopsis edwardii]